MISCSGSATKAMQWEQSAAITSWVNHSQDYPSQGNPNSKYYRYQRKRTVVCHDLSLLYDLMYSYGEILYLQLDHGSTTYPCPRCKICGQILQPKIGPSIPSHGVQISGIVGWRPVEHAARPGGIRVALEFEDMPLSRNLSFQKTVEMQPANKDPNPSQDNSYLHRKTI
jgi:hypothetical protein